MSFEPMQGIAVAQTPALVAPPLPPRRVSNNPPRLYSSLTDDELHIHLRRFNKQARHITAVSLPPGRLDFSPSASNGEAFSPDKLRSNLERLYLTVIKDVERALQEIKRLRSWSNPLRTFVWAAVYFGAWRTIGVGPLILAVIALLVASPRARQILFPSESFMTQENTSTDTPALHESDLTLMVSEEQQRELEAQVFAEDIADLATVQRPVPNADEQATTVVSEVVENSPSSPTNADGPSPSVPDAEHKAKTDRLAKHGLPVQRFAGDLADAWERWANALSPTAPPMHPHAARRRLALHIAPLGVLLACMPAALIMKGCALVAGLLFFSEPLVGPTIAFLDNHRPEWREDLEIRNSLLHLVPSNTQLTVAILRDTEKAGKPLPPAAPLSTVDSAVKTDWPDTTPAPPLPPRKPSRDTTSTDGSASSSSSPDFATVKTAPQADVAPTVAKQAKKDRFACFVSSAAKAAEQGAGYVSGEKRVNWEKVARVAVDKIKSTTGSELPEFVMNVIPRNAVVDRSNAVFYAHHNGSPGHLILSLLIHPSHLLFKPVSGSSSSSSSALSLALPDIRAVRKTEGLGWKSRLALGWSTGIGNIGDGLRVRVKDKVQDDEAQVKVETKATAAATGPGLDLTTAETSVLLESSTQTTPTSPIGSSDKQQDQIVSNHGQAKPGLRDDHEHGHEHGHEHEHAFTAIIRRDELFNRLVGNLPGQFELR